MRKAIGFADTASRGYTALGEDKMFRRTRYQYYTNVTYRTCVECLSWHGAIRKKPSQFPDPQDGCERVILPIPRGELKAYREKGQRMRTAAAAERRRRELFEQGLRLFAEAPATAIENFREAARIDLYIPELESLAERHAERLARDLALRDGLRRMFAKAYSDKFGWRRYERLPEMMRIKREKAGLKRINELFG